MHRISQGVLAIPLLVLSPASASSVKNKDVATREARD